MQKTKKKSHPFQFDFSLSSSSFSLSHFLKKEMRPPQSSVTAESLLHKEIKDPVAESPTHEANGGPVAESL